MRVELLFREALQAVRTRAMPVVSEHEPSAGVAPRMDPLGDRVRQLARESDQRITLSRALASALEASSASVDERIDQARSWILELALSLAGQVLERELDAGSYELEAPLESCLQEAFERSGKLRVYVHVDDLAAATELVQSAAQEAGLQEAPRIEADPDLARATCRVETSAGQLRHDPRLLLEQAAQSLREAMLP